jgi:four helix bundle protein
MAQSAERGSNESQSAWGRAQSGGHKGIQKKGGTMAKFRFQDLEIWGLAIQVADQLFDIADSIEQKKLYRFAEQLRGAGMSMSNNIAEGSGSTSKKEFYNFLNIARRSTFENANILIVLEKRKLIDIKTLDSLLELLDKLCRKISSFQKALFR